MLESHLHGSEASAVEEACLHSYQDDRISPAYSCMISARARSLQGVDPVCA